MNKEQKEKIQFLTLIRESTVCYWYYWASLEKVKNWIYPCFG